MDADSLLSPALLKHKDLGASGRKTSHKNEEKEKRKLESDVCRDRRAAQAGSPALRAALTGVRRRCRLLSPTRMKLFALLAEAARRSYS